MTAAVTPPGYCGYCTVPRQGSQEDIYKPIGVRSNIIQIFRLSHEAEFRSRCWSLVRMLPQ